LQEGVFSFLELETILSNLSDSDKKSEWYIIFYGIDDYIQYANLKNGIILDWPYNIKNTKRNYSQYLKVISELRNLRYILKKRKSKCELHYEEYWTFKEYHKEIKKIFRLIDLNIGKDYTKIINFTKYLFQKIFYYDNNDLENKIKIEIGKWKNKNATPGVRHQNSLHSFR